MKAEGLAPLIVNDMLLQKVKVLHYKRGVYLFLQYPN
jgi:hypothetical protein